jgi:metal-dependent amidase/aminoacylase/carboxypeptidase family protein
MKTLRTILVIWTLAALAAQGATAGVKDMTTVFDKAVSELAPGITKIQEDIHSHPELSTQETRTAALMTEALPTVEKVLGGRRFLVQDPPEMGGEDFSCFAKLIPSVMLKLGVMPEGKEGISVHSPYFVADQKAIPIGMRIMSRVIWDYCLRHRKA